MNDEEKLRDYLRQAAVDLHDARLSLQEAESRAHEPLAIVGMSCRYPGNVRSPEDLWRLVSTGTDAIGAFPTDRGWDLEGLYDPDPDRTGKSYARAGGFVDEADRFDAQFFGLSPREALAMDPKQRLLLEGAWEAFEDAQIDPSSLSGSQTGVFAGIGFLDYGVGLSPAVAESVEGYVGTGTAGSVVSGRVAYTFGLEGPAVSVDTACSSSLVALHMACQSLRGGECSLALAGGVTVMATPGVFVEFARQRGLSVDGRCKAFADAADGVGWSEGMGLVLLERFSDAAHNGRRVLGVVRGSAVNQDGASNGLTAPNGPSQQRVIARALANARVSPAHVDAVEGHGTGTTLGDPIEAQALLATYGQGRPEGRPLWLGSVKSNIGHTQAAAGVAGVIKMVMAMRHGVLPRTLHVDEPSSKVDWSEGHVALLTEERSWDVNGEPRRAGISSFGVSGTNAHVILEECPPTGAVAERAADERALPDVLHGDWSKGEAAFLPKTLLKTGVLPLLLSAKSAQAMSAQAASLHEHLTASPELDLDDVALSLTGRSAFTHRAVLLSGQREDLLRGLVGLAAGDAPSATVIQGTVAPGDPQALAFLFTGQGAQRAGMGRELYEVFPAFRSALDQVCTELDERLGRPLSEVLFASEGSPEADLMDQTLFTQAGLFALEVALFRLVEDLGVRPDFLMGHSIGELAAAHAAGVFSLRDACTLVAARGRLMGDLPAGGAMVSIEAAEQETVETLRRYKDRVSLAAVNGLVSVVVSGDEDAVLEVESEYRRRGRKTKRLNVSHAFHSHRMEGMLDEYRRVAQKLSFGAPQIPMVSNLTGELVGAERVCTAEYWVEQVRAPVRFADGVRCLDAQGIRSFLELGPEGVLSAMTRDCLDQLEATSTTTIASPLLRRERAEAGTLLGALASAWVNGIHVEWRELFKGSSARKVSLPTYAFQRERYWLTASPYAGDMAAAGQASADHPLLGAVLALADDRGWVFTGQISLESHPWLADHAVMGRVLLPGTALLELALHAGARCGSPVVAELTLESPLTLPERGALQLQVVLAEPEESGMRSLSIHSRLQGTSGDGEIDAGEWTSHANGVLVAEGAPDERIAVTDGSMSATLADAGVPGGQPWPPADAEIVEIDGIYDELAEIGLEYGPVFQGLRRAWKRGEEVFAEIALPDDHLMAARSFGLHPALLDAALHASGLGLRGVAKIEGEQGGVRLPFSWSRVELHASGASTLRVCLSALNSGGLSLRATDETGGLVVAVESLASRTLTLEQLGDTRDARGDSLFNLDWTVLPGAVAPSAPADAVLLGEADSPLGRSLIAAGDVNGVHANLRLLRESVDAAGGGIPGLVLVDCAAVRGDDLLGTMHYSAHRALELLQDWLAEERFSDARLVLITQGAIAVVAQGGLSGLGQSPVWGLVRSAQSEHPERFALLDIDERDASLAAMRSALVLDEPQLALRDGAIYAPRLARAVPAKTTTAQSADKHHDRDHVREDAGGFGPQGTVLITGGTGTLGRLLARHLVVKHGVGHLLLVSRRGERADGADALRAELEALDATVQIASCDVSDRKALEELLEPIRHGEHPLRGVVHTAGVLDDGVIGSLTRERMDGVLSSKADAAWNLHELTQHLDLGAFVLFSSAAGVLGSPGQGNYAAANAFLDALAAHRRSLGLAATSIAWGLWEQTSELTEGLSEADHARLARSGLGTLSAERGLELLGTVLARGETFTLAVPLDRAALRTQARMGVLPPMLSGLAGVSAGAARGHGGALARRLAGASPAEHENILLEVVRSEVAAVLGHASQEAIDVQLAFKDLGFDSLAAVELRNRLNGATGLRLPATLVFDYPTTTALVGYLLNELAGARSAAVVSIAPARTLDEPIAIVGMSCRYPGGVHSPEELWELVRSGVDGISGFPSDRGWDLERLYDPDPDNPGTSYAREGGFLHDAGRFDAEFFGISPSEALVMDPQQRLLLEGAWEVLEDAGIDPHSLKGSQTGVFAGLMYHEYGVGSIASRSRDVETYGATGNAGSVLSGRIAYTFGLEGPAVTVDTACSSSLVALHLASQALRGGECSLALAGGVTVMTLPLAFVGFSRQRGLAPDGRCKSFADAADGVGWSEGVGLLLLERLSDARRNGHRVLGLVRGSAVNQDGASNGLTAPNGPSQQRVIAQALAAAGLAPGRVDVVEGHGTGTTLGDPIEAQALLAVYGRNRSRDRPLWLGSVKSNIGHTQAAAGVAGVIKMVQAMRHGVLPRTLHSDEPSSHVDWSAGTVALLREQRPWEANGEPRRAGVSSFGVSGTNAHVILEEAPPTIEEPASSVLARSSGGGVLGTGAPLWAFSARGEESLRAQAQRLREFAEGDPECRMEDVGRSLAGRCTFEHRAVALGGERGVLLDGLRALERGNVAADVVAGVASPTGGVVFVFPGQGGQWVGMALELLDRSSVFAEGMRACGEALSAHVRWSLEGVLRGDPGEPGLERVDVVQPALFAVMVSLAGLWRACGVHPDVVVGHSQGEIAAAYVAGGLSLQDAVRVIALRSQALLELAGRGGMVSVALSAGDLAGRLERWDGRLGIAAINGPSAVVVSGGREALGEFLVECLDEGIRAREIPVDYAAHSRAVEEIREELLAGCAGIEPCKGEIPFHSTVTGGPLDTAALDGEYWYRNLRETVRFEGAVQTLLEDGRRAFIELSPHPVLTMSIQDSTEEALGDPGEVVAVGSLRRQEGGPERFSRSLAEAWTRGVQVDWGALYEDSAAREVKLPTYAFQRKRYWLEGPSGAGDAGSLGQSATDHPLLGAMVELADGERRLFTGRVSLQEHPWLADHVVLGRVLLPGTAFLELALGAGERVGCPTVRELTLESPLLLPERGAMQLQLVLGEPDESRTRSFDLYSRPEPIAGEGSIAAIAEPWMRHASGVLGAAGDGLEGARKEHAAQRVRALTDARSWPPRGAEPVQIDGLYDALAELGFEYGPAFRGLRAVWRRGSELFAEIILPEQQGSAVSGFGVHPALLDAALHPALSLLLEEGTDAGKVGGGGLRLPFSFGGVELYGAGAGALRVALDVAGEHEDAIALLAADDTGRLIVALDSLMVREITPTQLGAPGRGDRDSLFRLDWSELTLAPQAGAPRRLALLEDKQKVVVRTSTARLAESLREAGCEVQTYRDLASLGEALDADGASAPEFVLVDCAAHRLDSSESDAGPAAVHNCARWALDLVQSWLADERFVRSRLALLTRGAVAVRAGEDLPGLAQSPLWGLVRSAQSEQPERLLLIDVDDRQSTGGVLAGALGTGEPQLALRDDTVLAPRLARAGADVLTFPAGIEQWRLQAGDRGTLKDLSIVAHPQAVAPLEHGQVRVGVRSAGLNFRDVMVTLGLVTFDSEARSLVGGECAGVVLECGPGVEGLTRGDRVMGVFTGLGSVLVTDQRLLVRIPAGLSFAQAASMPVAFLTAYYGLVDLAGLGQGERLLVHAGTGGVGMVAVQLARHLGAEVFATASPAKWQTLRAMGLDEAHIASSRTLEFRECFLEQTGGRGMDVVLDSLAGEFVDASLDLLSKGGRFLEMGKTDIRDPRAVAGAHPGVSYCAFDLVEAGAERTREMLGEMLELLASGALEAPSVRAWDVRRAPEAFRFMSQARHTGKLALSLPVGLDPEGTVLITGGTGTLGALLAGHLVREHGVRHLLLVSRSGERGEGAGELLAQLRALGADVDIAACDVSRREELVRLLESIPAKHPLCGVVHAAGALDDGVVGSLTAEGLDSVLAPKVDAAWHLHELTECMDLSMFVLFSSAAGVLGSPGQANYAAANAFLDALAAHRRVRGLPGLSLAWGLWEQVSALTGDLSEADIERMARSGVRALGSEEGLRLFDRALEAGESMALPVPLDLPVLRALARTQELPPMFADLVRVAARPHDGQVGGLARRMAAAGESEREGLMLELVRAQVATVLGRSSAEAIDARRTFNELGFDSLTAVELRNRLNAATGLRLPATLIFDYPTPTACAGYLLGELDLDPGLAAQDTAEEELDRLEALLFEGPSDDTQNMRVAARLQSLLLRLGDRAGEEDLVGDGEVDFETASDDEMFELIDRELE